MGGGAANSETGYNGIDTGLANPQSIDFSDYAKTAEGQKFQSMFNVANRPGTQIFQRGGGYMSANQNDGYGGEMTAQDVTGLMTAYLQWKAQQDNSQKGWQAYADASKAAPGRDQTQLVQPTAIIGNPAQNTQAMPRIGAPKPIIGG